MQWAWLTTLIAAVMAAGCAPSPVSLDSGSAVDGGPTGSLDAGPLAMTDGGGLFSSDVDPDVFGRPDGGRPGPSDNDPGYHLRSTPLSTFDFYGAPPDLGTDGGDYTERVLCPSGEVVVGLVGRVYDYGVTPPTYRLTALAVRCSKVRISGSIESPGTALALVGGASGAPYSDPCPADSVLVRLRMHQARSSNGMWSITNVGGRCAPLREWISSQTLGVTLPDRGSGDGEEQTAQTCPASAVIVGLDVVTQGTAVFGLRAICASVVFTPA